MFLKWNVLTPARVQYFTLSGVFTETSVPFNGGGVGLGLGGVVGVYFFNILIKEAVFCNRINLICDIWLFFLLTHPAAL